MYNLLCLNRCRSACLLSLFFNILFLSTRLCRPIDHLETNTAPPVANIATLHTITKIFSEKKRFFLNFLMKMSI